jgi:hypothetical protein
LYGSSNHACIALNVGQIWEREFKPTEQFPFHKLKRQNVLIEVVDEDFKSCFEPLKGSE